jgi:hypothetical protein
VRIFPVRTNRRQDRENIPYAGPIGDKIWVVLTMVLLAAAAASMLELMPRTWNQPTLSNAACICVT